MRPRPGSPKAVSIYIAIPIAIPASIAVIVTTGAIALAIWFL